MERRFRNAKWHPGITMHKIQFDGGIARTIFTVGCLTIILMKLPEFWSFLGATAAFGVVMSFAVKWINQHMQHDIESIGTQLR
jgi:hypothetical protein